MSWISRHRNSLRQDLILGWKNSFAATSTKLGIITGRVREDEWQGSKFAEYVSWWQEMASTERQKKDQELLKQQLEQSIAKPLLPETIQQMKDGRTRGWVRTRRLIINGRKMGSWRISCCSWLKNCTWYDRALKIGVRILFELRCSICIRSGLSSSLPCLK